jgi:hypothetical protein
VWLVARVVPVESANPSQYKAAKTGREYIISTVSMGNMGFAFGFHGTQK